MDHVPGLDNGPCPWTGMDHVPGMDHVTGLEMFLDCVANGKRTKGEKRKWYSITPWDIKKCSTDGIVEEGCLHNSMFIGRALSCLRI